MLRNSLISLVTLMLAACGVFEPSSGAKATLQADVPKTNLRATDTLVVRRTVRNVSHRELWLELSSTGYGITAANGDRACFFEFTTLEMTLRRIPPDSTVVDERRVPLGSLPRCGPGEYQIVVYASLYETQFASPAPAVTLQSQARPLVVTAASTAQ